MKTLPRKQRTHAKQHGFTLIEILVAVAVFGFLAAASFTTLNSVLKTREFNDNATESLRQLQMSMTILQRDFMQLTDTSINDEYGDPLPPIYTPTDNSSLVEFTHSGWHNPANRPRSNLQRVAYVLEDGKLYREYWPQLHRGRELQPIRAVLLKNVEEVEFEFLDENKERWQEQWPPPNLDQAPGLPIATRITITFKDETQIIRLFGVNR